MSPLPCANEGRTHQTPSARWNFASSSNRVHVVRARVCQRRPACFLYQFCFSIVVQSRFRSSFVYVFCFANPSVGCKRTCQYSSRPALFMYCLSQFHDAHACLGLERAMIPSQSTSARLLFALPESALAYPSACFLLPPLARVALEGVSSLLPVSCFSVPGHILTRLAERVLRFLLNQAPVCPKSCSVV
jgi:hypothetical protein